MTRLDRIAAQLPEYGRWVSNPSEDDLRLLIDAARALIRLSPTCKTAKALLAEEPS